MARRARVEYPGALYHVITRGNQRQRIFRDDGTLRKDTGFRASLSPLRADIQGSHATCVSRNVARMESRLGSDKKLKKVFDKIVSSSENGKYHA
jgi:hypothetical protein